MIKQSAATLCLALLCANALAQSSAMRCTDANGKPVYTNNPTPALKCEALQSDQIRMSTIEPSRFVNSTKGTPDAPRVAPTEPPRDIFHMSPAPELPPSATEPTKE